MPEQEPEDEQRVQRHHDRGDALRRASRASRSARRRRCALRRVTIASPPRRASAGARAPASPPPTGAPTSRSMPDVQVHQQMPDAGEKMMEIGPREHEQRRAWRTGARACARICAQASGDASARCTTHSSERDADRNRSAPRDPVQDRNERRQRLPDGEQVEVDRARLGGGTVQRSHREANPRRTTSEP